MQCGIDAVPTQMDYGELVSLDAQCPHLDNVFGPAGLHSPSTLRHLASWSSWTYAVLYDLFCIHIGHPNPLGMHAVELLDIFQRVLGGQDSVLREWRAVRPCVPEFLGRPLAHVGRGGTAAAAASSAGPNIGPENASLRSAGRSVFFRFPCPNSCDVSGIGRHRLRAFSRAADAVAAGAFRYGLPLLHGWERHPYLETIPNAPMRH